MKKKKILQKKIFPVIQVLFYTASHDFFCFTLLVMNYFSFWTGLLFPLPNLYFLVANSMERDFSVV